MILRDFSVFTVGMITKLLRLWRFRYLAQTAMHAMGPQGFLRRNGRQIQLAMRDVRSNDGKVRQSMILMPSNGLVVCRTFVVEVVTSFLEPSVHVCGVRTGPGQDAHCRTHIKPKSTRMVKAISEPDFGDFLSHSHTI